MLLTSSVSVSQSLMWSVLTLLYFSVCNQILSAAPDSLVSFIIGPKHQRSDASAPHGVPEHLSATTRRLVFNCDSLEQRTNVIASLQPFLQGEKIRL